MLLLDDIVLRFHYYDCILTNSGKVLTYAYTHRAVVLCKMIAHQGQSDSNSKAKRYFFIRMSFVLYNLTYIHTQNDNILYKMGNINKTF